MTGTTRRVKIIELKSPPMIEMAMGAFVSLPKPVLMAKGIMAKIMAMVVMRMGRRRFSPASEPKILVSHFPLKFVK